LKKLLRSAIANAERKAMIPARRVDVDRLREQAYVNEGRRWKRLRPRRWPLVPLSEAHRAYFRGRCEHPYRRRRRVGANVSEPNRRKAFEALRAASARHGPEQAPANTKGNKYLTKKSP